MTDDFNNHPLWKFSLAVYGAPGVASACLDLQERRGADVNLLLYAAFVGTSGRGLLSPDALAQCAAMVAPWSQAVVQTLRAARRALKGDLGVDGAAAALLRRQVQAIEIEAERLEQMTLATRLPPLAGRAPSDRQADARANIETYLSMLAAADTTKDAAAITAIAASFPPSD
jgi:uncharacterized protein (TIGR02444 family)